MEPLDPIAGVSLEQYAELCALVVDHPDDLARWGGMARVVRGSA